MLEPIEPLTAEAKRLAKATNKLAGLQLNAKQVKIRQRLNHL